jgi:DNA-binding response OmpR family regulator
VAESEEAHMLPDAERRLAVLCRQLTEAIMTAALCANEVATIIHQLHSAEDHYAAGDAERDRRRANCVQQRPIMDESTLSVVWNGRVLYLGHTHAFWLLARLTRSANQYVTHLDLVQEIWDDDFTDTAALRAGVTRLRAKLRHGGMPDLADAIVGHHGRYMLNLSECPRHTDVTSLSH